MNPPFESLSLVIDPEPHSGAMNMAVDELLFQEASLPLLRVYRWERPTVSFGYFEKVLTVRALYPGWDLVRRWTGGGLVEHGADFTYSLIVPSGHEFLKLRTASSYEEIHLRVVLALEQAGLRAMVTPKEEPKISNACFENPAQFDVLVGGKKVAGAAQRRSRMGMLHQGSIQNSSVPDGFGQILAGKLAQKSPSRTISKEELAKAESLAAQKYGALQWLEKF